MSALTERISDEVEQFVARLRGNKSVQDLEHKYNALTDRDRLAVNVLSFFLVLFVLFQFIYIF